MAHLHDHSSGDAHGHRNVTKNIALAFFLNLSFSLFELIGGLFTNSIAILSDALHDFGDSISLGLAWYLEKLSKRSRTNKYSYGFKRFSLLGAIINSLVLLVGSIIVIYESIGRIIHPQQVHAEGMLWLAIIGVAVNGFVFLRGRGTKSLNERTVSLHFLEDALGWIAVLIASIVMMFVDIPRLDSILSVCIALFILYNVFRNLNASVRVILQEVPSTVDMPKVMQDISRLEHVEEVSDMHIWSLDSEYHIASVLVSVDDSVKTICDSYNVVIEVKKVFARYAIEHSTIEIRPANAEKNIGCPIDDSTQIKLDNEL